MRVKLYTDSRCLACSVARDYLRSRGVEYEERPISEVPLEECNLAPVVEVGSEIVYGFDRRRIEELLR